MTFERHCYESQVDHALALPQAVHQEVQPCRLQRPPVPHPSSELARHLAVYRYSTLADVDHEAGSLARSLNFQSCLGAPLF